MKKILISCVALFLFLHLSAQEIVSTQGDSYANSHAAIDFTIGDVLVKTGSDGIINLSQGFQQPFQVFIGISEQLNQAGIEVFPNPARDVIYINAPQFKGLNYQLYDLHGKIVLKGTLSKELMAVSIARLPAGNYFITLSDQREILNTIVLIKNN